MKVRSPFSSRIASVSLLLFSISAQLWGATYGPGWWSLQPNQIPAGQFVSIPEEENQLLMAGVDEVTPEIAELAYGLEYEPLRIFEFVRNHIQYTPYWGSLKGAGQTLLDRAGNDMDQASLMIALLKASNIECSYLQGTMTVSLGAAADWLGCEESCVTNFLNMTGIYYVRADPFITINRFWVNISVGGNLYQADPAYKPSIRMSPIDLSSRMNYNRNNLLSVAVPGGQSGIDYVQQLYDANIRSKLQEYTTNLIVSLRNSHPNADISEIIGGTAINEQEYSSFPSLSYTHGQSGSFTTIPTQYVHYVQIQLGTINQTLKISEIAGQRLAFTFNIDSPPKATVWLDDEQKWTESSASGSEVVLSVIVHHPYGQSFSSLYTLKRGATNSYVIVSAFKGSENGNLLKRRQKILTQYRMAGYVETSREVRTESLNVIGQTWMQENLLSEKTLMGLNNKAVIVFHDFALVAQEAGYYIDAKTALHCDISRTANGTGSSTEFHSSMFIRSAMEHGVLEQMQETNTPGISTIKILWLANQNSNPNANKIFYATRANYNTVVLPAIGTNYTTAEKQSFSNWVYAGGSAVIPQQGNVLLNQWRGKGYILAAASSLEMAISGGLFGGVGTLPEQVQSLTIINNSIPYHVLSPSLNYSKSDEPVVLATCAYDFETTDLSLGNNAISGLQLVRSYSSSRNTTLSPLGYGWTHNFASTATSRSDPDSGLGLRSAEDAAAFLVAAVVTRDLVANESNARGWVTASLVNKWAMDQLTDNAVVVQRGPKSWTFIRQPDGSYTPPPGITDSLTKNGSQYRVTERFGNAYQFNSDGMLDYSADADSNRTSYVYSDGLLQAVSNAFGYRFSFSYSSGDLDSVSDSAGRTADYAVSGKNLTQFSDPAGKAWQVVYDAEHRIVALKDPLNQTTISNRYAASGCVTAQVSATGYQWLFRNSIYRNIEENPQGGKNIYFFDDRSREVGRQDALGSRIYSSFDGQNHVISNINARGYATALYYDGLQNVTSVVDALNNRTMFAYDAQNHLVTQTDPLGNTTRFQYDAEHHLTNVVGALTNSTRTVYFANGLAKMIVNPRGSQIVYAYDSFGNPLTIQRSDGGTVTNTYTQAGDLLTSKDPNGNAMTLAYDSRRLLLKESDALGNAVSNAYNDAGLLVSTRDQRGHITTSTYTPSYKLKAVSYPDGGVVSNFYDSRDWLVSVRDQRGGISFNQYDSAGRVTNVIDALNHSLASVLDAAGNVIAVRDALGNSASNIYDALNRVTKSTDPLGHSVQRAYDAAGRMTSEVDQAGVTTIYGYDALGRMISKSHLNVTEFYQYDAVGNLLRFVNGEGQPMSFGYDAQNRQVAETNASGFVKRKVLDNAGNLVSRIDAQSRSTAYQYDAANRLSRTIYPNGQTNSYFYDAGGNLTNTVDSLGATRYRFDAMNRLSSVTDSRGQTVSNQYDLAGNRIAVWYPGNRKVAFDYDTGKRQTNVVDWSTNRMAYSFDAANRLTGMAYPNGVIANFSHDNNARVVGYSYSRAGSNLIARSMTRNALGFKHRESIMAGLEPMPPAQLVQNRTYSPADRLTNIEQKAAPDSPTSSNVVWYYDIDGNLLSNNAGYALSYDFDNRVIAWQSAGATWRFAYDASGARVSYTQSGFTNYYVLDQVDPLKRPLVEMNSAGQPLRYWIWSPLGLIAQAETNGIVRYVHSDEQGSVLALTDASGNLTSQFAYSPYGQQVSRTGSDILPFTWLGEYGVRWVGDQLYLTINRAYDAGLMRFTSGDPIGLSGGNNLYIYANGTPTAFVDPSGLYTYLLVVGGDPHGGDIFQNAARNRSREILSSQYFNPERDNVSVVNVEHVSQFSKSLSVNKDIVEISYYGHGGPGVLYLTGSEGKPFNVSVNGGAAAEASDSMPISALPNANVMPGANINLYSCYSTVSKEGIPSIAQGFADRFQSPVQGAGAGVGYDAKGPYIRGWRAALSAYSSLSPYYDGGGGWKTVKPGK